MILRRKGKVYVTGNSGFTKTHIVGKSTGDERYAGHGTALKPAHEPVIVARKPLAEKTVARNVLAHGTGAINVDACRIGATVETWPKSRMYGGKSDISFTNPANPISAQST